MACYFKLLCSLVFSVAAMACYCLLFMVLVSELFSNARRGDGVLNRAVCSWLLSGLSTERALLVLLAHRLQRSTGVIRPRSLTDDPVGPAQTPKKLALLVSYRTLAPAGFACAKR